jgi:hypothetical protein
MDVPGIQRPVIKQQQVATGECCSGPGRRGVLGELVHALEQQEVATLTCCSGLEEVGVPGIKTPVKQQLRVGI